MSHSGWGPSGDHAMFRSMRWLCLSLPIAWAGVALGQGSDAALKDRVAQLVAKLDKPDADAAEKALIKLGQKVLPLLPERGKVPAAARERLAKVREAILAEVEQANLGASKITIQGQGIRLSEVLKQLQAQSGNRLTDLREQMGGDASNPSLDLDLKGVPFFEALDQIAKKGEFGVNFFTGDGTIGLTPGGSEATKPDYVGQKPFTPLVQYVGPFRVAYKQFVAARDLQNGGGSANAQFEIAWEPRLRPMLLALKTDEIEIVDDKGDAVAPSVMGESSSVVLRP